MKYTLGYLLGIWLGRKLAGWWLGAFLIASPLSSQTPAFTYVTDSVRAGLIKDWDSVATSAYQVERAYCIKYDIRVNRETGNWLFIVTKAIPAKVGFATNTFISYAACERGLTAIHIHTPTTCADGKCRFGGFGAYNCEPSDIDRQTLQRMGAPFAGVQCSREAVAFYYNRDLKPVKPHVIDSALQRMKAENR